MSTIAVVGLGCVGLPLAMAFGVVVDYAVNSPNCAERPQPRTGRQQIVRCLPEVCGSIGARVGWIRIKMCRPTN
jgi:hypothetical protein